MNRLATVVAFATVLLCCARGSSQQSGFGVNPRNVTFKPIDTTNIVGGGRLPAGPSGGSKLMSYLPKLSLSGLFTKPVIGRSALPSPSSMPGANHKSVIQPVAPINP